MTRKLATLLALLLIVPLLTFAQEDFALGQDDAEAKGRNWGGYTVHQSIEFGGRVADIEGNGNVYNTFVNLHSGPRLLSQELSMQAAPGTGLLFDKLYLSSFGFGGDPNQLARLRMQKSQLYNLVVMYRRDKNYWDYNLFGNPLTTNLQESVATGGRLNPQNLFWYTNSTRPQIETRNMGDALLTLFPQSKVSVRLGYSINDNHGFFGSTLETPIQIPVGENAGWRSYRYQVGFDLKMLPKTTVSIDQFFAHEKTDLNYVDDNLLFNLGSATGPAADVNLFSSFPPCSGFLLSSGVLANNPACIYLLSPNGSSAAAYSKRGIVSTNIPTTQLSLRSNYFRKLDITADGSYSAASSHFLKYSEFVNVFNNTTSTFISPGPNLAVGTPHNQTITASADLGLTYHFSRSWSFNDKFRWVDWRENGVAPITTYTCAPQTGVGPLTGTSLSPIVSPCNSLVQALLAGQPFSSTLARSSSFNYAQTVTSLSLIGERSYFNTATVNWQPKRLFSAFAGFRYGRRELKEGTVSTGDVTSQVTSTLATTAGSTAVPTVPRVTLATVTPVDTPRINQYTGLAGVVLRPTEAWRINTDAEMTYADNAFVNLYPRHQQKFRISTNYKVNRWSSVNASVAITEDRNDFAKNFDDSGLNLFPTTIAPAYGSKTHFRYYTLGATLNPNSRVTVDAGYTYMDQKMLTQTCLPVITPNVIVGGFPAQDLCTVGPDPGGEPMTLDYTETTNTFYANIAFRPVKRVTINLGYEITSDNGRNKWLRGDTGKPLQVYGDIYGNAVGIPNTAAMNPPTSCNGGPCVIYTDLNPNQPNGPQTFTWHKPSAGLEVGLSKGLAFKGTWAFYDYNEKGDIGVVGAAGGVGPLLPRNFHANVGTLALKYSF